VSSLATATTGTAPDAPSPPEQAPSRLVDLCLTAALAAGLVAVAFTTGGGIVPGSDAQLAANTWTELALLALAAGAGLAALLVGRPAPSWGAGAQLSFAALVALTAASIAWSVSPDASWRAADQALSYLAAFVAAGWLARIAPERWPVLVGALALATVIPSGWALAVKVFPAALDAGDHVARLNAPVGYQNATGLTAAMGLAPCLWWASRRDARASLRGLAVVALAVLASATVLSYSRGALVAAIVGCAAYLIFAPPRLRAAAALIVGLLGAGVIAGWAIAHPALSTDSQPLWVRDPAGHTWGAVIVVALCACGALAWALARAAERRPPSPRARRQAGIVLLCLLALVPVGAIGALAASRHGLTGEVSHLFSQLTSTTATVGGGAGRLASTASSRTRYWSEAVTVFDHALLNGVGALGFQTAAVRYPGVTLLAAQAHSYVAQTLADLGALGIVVSLLLLGAWGRAALRSLSDGWAGLPGRKRASERTVAAGQPGRTRPGEQTVADADADARRDRGLAAERAGLAALLGVALAFGIESAIDWTWFIPAEALPALLAAGWLAGRGPLRQPVGRLARRRRLLDDPRLPPLATLMALVTLSGAYVIWQPLRAVRADDAAVAAAGAGRLPTAIGEARAAVADDPLSLAPREELASLYLAAGQTTSARRVLAAETRVAPEDWQSWQDLGVFDVNHGRFRQAAAELGHAVALNLYDTVASADLDLARSHLGAHR